ncbi:MAG: division/cell wall cluster transcriptional repressor MraZ [Deltaproteobacteria bacterium]|nr:division/cell wall cluster transcriptional repressor MraZ [Deltaproteobacteria bacterium]
MFFRGRYEYSLDTKGRLNIPAKFREIIVGEYNSELVITTALEGCLDCFPLKIWTQVEDKLNSLPSSRIEVKRFKRFYISGAVECSLDKQGRVLLPPTLRNWAGLDQKENNVVIAGQIDKLEFWSQERWGVEALATTGSAADIKGIVEALEELGVSI